jgi:hypothetical protein
MCDADERMVKATCIAARGTLMASSPPPARQTPRTLGENGAICEVAPRQTEIAQAVIVCEKR